MGEAKIEKGEGMELDQLLQNASAVENRHPDMHPFDMGILTEAFKMRETSHADLPYAENGTGRKMFELNGDSIDNKKHEKHKIRDKDKSMDLARRHHQKNSGTKKDDGKTRKGHHDIDPNNLQKLQDNDKKRKFKGGDDFSGIQKCQKTKLKNLKVKNVGMSRITN
ncbi:Mediator of RNA polymerase II transcription subunit 19a [Heracleum sosnowskyi]|uniref:Mediator of RNA polymerase II transcription subunit 19a n=1 Tax=Heracleum sosnowskyi TaxID=360622 RepID=A0AAD8MMX4_9APIA|nr:Mediator of RNA polymerase II transcription subunit 19a [Heracleum sosnowskyi]